MEEPAVKRAVSFIDGQNLFRHAKDAFGFHHPNHDPVKLHRSVSESRGWQPVQVRFHSGIPTAEHNAFWHGYRERRLLSMRRQGVEVITRRLRYRTIETCDEYGQPVQRVIAQEKGIDVRLALDIVRLARKRVYDVAIIFSQDQDLAEVVEEVRDIAREQGRWIKLASAFPAGGNATAWRGIDRTDWIQLDRAWYEACLDPRDYRPRQR